MNHRWNHRYYPLRMLMLRTHARCLILTSPSDVVAPI